MKTNRLTFFVCSALVVVCAIAYLLSAEGLSIEVFQNLLMGITTGAIISVVISLIGYFRDRDALVFKATNTSVNAYIDLSVLRELTGYALGSIGHTEKMRDIPFNIISSIARKTFDDCNDVSSELYAPFYKSGELARRYRDFASFRSVFQNMALIAQSIESISLQIDNEVMRTTIASANLCQPTQPLPQLQEWNKLLLVRVSKFHEHVTDRTMQYEAIAQYFVNRAHGKNAWKNARQKIDAEVAEIMSNYAISDTSIS